jgi:hypothetical protein
VRQDLDHPPSEHGGGPGDKLPSGALLTYAVIMTPRPGNFPAIEAFTGASVALERPLMIDAPKSRNGASIALGLAVATLTGAAALAPGTARAADWWYVNQGQDRVMLIDVASIKSERGLLAYWNTQVIADGAEDGVRMVKSYMLADCAKARGGWGMIVRYDRDDRQLNVDSLAKPPLAAVEPGTLGEAELKFVCAKPDDREASGAFSVAIDARTFADALIVAGDEAPRAVYDRLSDDAATPIVRSTAPGPETFGQRQTVKAGQPLVPPRDYAKGTDVPNPADYPRDSSGDAYDVTFEGLEAGQMKFEVRGYSADDLIHPAMGQTERFPAGLKAIHIRDLAIAIDAATDEAITYRVKIEKEAAAQ